MHRLTATSGFCCRRICKEWLPKDELAHFIAAAERVRQGAFRSNRQAGGKPQYHPRLMLALRVYCYANGIFSSRRIERATYRDIGARFIAANPHPDHDTIATFRRTNKAAFEAAFLERKQTVEPVFGIIKSAIGLTRFHLRSRDKPSTEWLVVALAYNCRCLCRLRTA